LNSPFNEAKYKALLEGLEIKETLFSKTVNNKDFRIDSQFYTKEPIKNPKLEYGKIGNLLIKAQYGISISMNEEGDGYPIYRMNEIHNMLCDIDVSKFAKITHEEYETFRLNDREVLFNRTNSFEWVGRTGLYRKTDDKDFVFASYLVRFIPDEKKLLPEYLTAFLNTRYGIWDIKRRARQSINQTNVNPEEVKEIEIPLLGNDFQKSIKDFFDTAHANRVKSLYIYNQAEQILLEELGLKDFEPSNEPVNIKSFQESFLSTGRLDAEYYQKKYEDFIGLIKSYRNGFELFSSVCNLKDKNFNPDGRQEYKYIELANIGKTGDITGCTVSLGSDLPTRARRIVHENDVIISSIEGSLDSCALITKEYDNALCSTGFYVINSNKINSETLLILFKSELIQNILKKGCSGTILTAINKTELKQIPIPLVDYTKQQEISELVEESFALKKQSEEILETAKRAVEIAIEEDEKKAIEYIKSEVSYYVS